MSGRVRKVSLSTGLLQGRFGDEQAIRIARQIGADAIEFSTASKWFDYRNPESIYSRGEEEIISYFASLKKVADELGIEIGQTHGRMEGFRGDPAEDEALLKNARLDCLAAKMLGAPVCVVHNVTTIFMGRDAAPELMHRLNFDMYSGMLESAKKYGIKLATETFGDATGLNCCDFFGNISEFMIAYNRLCSVGDNADHLTACVDTGHSNKAMRFNHNPKPGDVIRMLGKNISVLHLNDNDGLTDQHKIPMTGSIDWNDVFDALDEIGYEGTYNMELNLNNLGKNFVIESAEFAVRLMKHILAERYGQEIR